MNINADLHIHSRFAMATSPDLSPQTILEGCHLKGIDAVGTGDALHPEWRRMWKDHLYDDDSVIAVPQTEVEDEKRVHHLILAETLDQFAELEDLFSSYCSHISTVGRPHLHANGERIAELVHSVGAMIGPAHAFTPWTSLFAAYKNPSDCYGGESIDFCELGLSADSSYGAGIPEFQTVPFLSNSDAHSQYPEKLGREFTCMSVSELTVKRVLSALKKSAITLNAGFFPEEGKYNRTACIRCFTQFSFEDAERMHWKCPHDGGRIKVGVRDRALSLSIVPEHERTSRPPYLKIIPLGEVIARVLGVSSPQTKTARNLYSAFLMAFKREIDVLLNVPCDDLKTISVPVAEAIESMRNGTVILYPGGGGKYGRFEFPQKS